VFDQIQVTIFWAREVTSAVQLEYTQVGDPRDVKVRELRYHQIGVYQHCQEKVEQIHE
jgi:hypothetical protein